MRRRKMLAIYLLVGLVALSASGLALAQTSPHFDLGCWGVQTSAGGEQQSANFRLTYTLGQVTAGGAESPNIRLRIGYSQDWRTLQPAIPTPGPVITSGTESLYLPIIDRYVPLIRRCAR